MQTRICPAGGTSLVAGAQPEVHVHRRGHRIVRRVEDREEVVGALAQAAAPVPLNDGDQAVVAADEQLQEGQDPVLADVPREARGVAHEDGGALRAVLHDLGVQRVGVLRAAGPQQREQLLRGHR